MLEFVCHLTGFRDNDHTLYVSSDTFTAPVNCWHRRLFANVDRYMSNSSGLQTMIEAILCDFIKRGHLALTCAFIMLLLFIEGSIPFPHDEDTSYPHNVSSHHSNPPSPSLSSNLSPSSIASKAIQWHRHYCGYNRVCDNYSPSTCYRCAPCRCDPMCQIYNDCCPDILFSKRFTLPTTNERVAATLQECLSVHVPLRRLPASNNNRRHTKTETKNVHNIFANRFFMVSRCPSNSQRDGKKECQDSEGEPPVTSVGNNSVVYRNAHCARCHGVKNVILWKISVLCPFYDANNSWSYSQNSVLTQFVLRGCDVVYSPPDNTPYRQCYSEPSMISKCNNTGQWRTHNEFLVRACASYLTPKVAEGKIYRNLFCYLCNKKDDSFDPHVDKCRQDPFHAETTFEAELDYEELIVAEGSPSFLLNSGYETCGDNGLYDADDRKCRQVSCVFGQRIDSTTGSCTPAFDEVKGLTYQLYFKLKPDSPIHLPGEYDYIHYLPSDIELVLRQKLEHNNVTIEDMSIAFNTSSDAGICSHSTIYNVALHATIKCTQRTNQTHIQKTLMAMRSDVFHIVNQRWNITLQGSPSKIPWFLLHQAKPRLPQSVTNCVKIVSKHVKRIRQDGTIRVGTTAPNPTKEDVKSRSPPAVHISKLMTCPHVGLLSSEYTVRGVGEGLRVSWQDELVSEDDYFMEQDGSITVCLSILLNKLGTNNQRRTSTEILCAMVLLPVSVVLLIVCLVIHLAFPALRSLPRKNNMLVMACLASSQTAILIGYNVSYYSDVCTAMGILAHYFSLCLFLALAVSSYHLYKMFSTLHLSVDATRERRTFCRYCCLIFTPPVFVVSIIIIISRSEDRIHFTLGYGYVALCFLTSPTAMWVAIFIPLVIFVAIYLVLFLLTYSALQSNADLEINVSDEKHVHFYFRSSLLVVITWTLGAIAFQTTLAAMRIVFIVAQFGVSLYIVVALVANKRVANLISATCCSRASQNKNTSTILELDVVNQKDVEISKSSVITTGYKQRDSPKSCGKSVDGDSMDALCCEDEGMPSRIINDGYSTIETIA